MKNYGICLIENTGCHLVSAWKVFAESAKEAQGKLLDFVKKDKGFQEFYKAFGGCFPYRTNYCGYSDSYTDNECLNMTADNLKKQYQSYAKSCKNSSEPLKEYCNKYKL